MIRRAFIAVLPFALLACQSEKKPAQAATAGGEILPGSTSDAMLPLDTVRSQAPLAPKSEVAPGDAKSAKKPSGAAPPAGTPAPTNSTATVAVPTPEAAPE